VLYRVTLTGDVPVGVDGVRSESVQGEAFSTKEHPNAKKRPAPKDERVEA
jgi:taurine dioxygenase